MADVGGINFNITATGPDLTAAEKRITEFANRSKTLLSFTSAEQGIQRLSGIGTRMQALVKPFGNLQNASEQVRKEFELLEKAAEDIKTSVDTDLKPVFAGANFTKFDEQVAKLRGTTTQTGVAMDTLGKKSNFATKLFGSFGNIVDRSTKFLGQFGLKASDVAIILGAGFAGGIAGFIQVGLQLISVLKQMAEAVIRFTVNAAVLGSQLAVLRSNVTSNFGDMSARVLEFADNATLAFGIAEKDALDFLNNMGDLLQSFGVSEKASAQMSISLFNIASALREGHESAGTFADAVKAVRDAVSGNLESLREFGVVIREQDLKNIAEDMRALGVPIPEGTFDSFIRGQLTILKLAEEAKKRLSEPGEEVVSLSEKFETFRNLMQKVVGELGDELAPVFDFLADAAIGFAVALLSTVRAIKDMVSNIREFFRSHQLLLEVFKKLGDQLERMFPALNAMGKILGFVADQGKAARAAAGDYASELGQLDQLTGLVTDSIRDHLEGLELTEEQLEKLRDAHEKFNDAIKDGAEDIADAEERLEDVRKDAAKRAEDAQKRLAEAIRDRGRAITDALEKIRETEEDNYEAIKDARENLQETIEDAQESIREAEEKLAKTRVDSAKRVEDAEEKLADARRARLEELLDAQISLEQALREGDVFAERSAALQLSKAKQGKGVADAREDVAETIRDANEKIAEAEAKLADVREDAAERVSDAQEKLADTIKDARKRMEEAERNYADTVEEQNERVRDAHDHLAETFEENKERIADAQENLTETTERAKERIDEARESLHEMNDEFGSWDLSLKEINLKLREMRKLVRDISEFAPVAGFVAGVNLSELSKIRGPFIPFQHGGGIHKGTLGIVGERGPELFIPNTSGTIVPNDQLIRAIQQLGSHGGNSQSITVVDSGDPEATAFMVAHRLMAGVNN